MKKCLDGFIFGLVVAVVWQECRIRKLTEKLDVVGDISEMLLEESYQREIDEEFEEIVEHNDLDD